VNLFVNCSCADYSAAGVYYSESEDEMLSPSSHDSLMASHEGAPAFSEPSYRLSGKSENVVECQ